MRNYLRQLFTERDNQTGDMKRLLWFGGFLWLVALETFAVVVRRERLDFPAVAAGLVAVLGVGAAGIAINRYTENAGPKG
jgi:hypothetical protein